MKQIFLIGLVLTLIATAAFAGGRNVTLETVIQGLEHQFRSDIEPGAAIEDLQADFLQQAYLGSISQVDTARGKIAILFRRNDPSQKQPSFRWEYQTPSVQQIISDGKTAWVYLPENNQAIKSTVPTDDSVETDSPLVFLTGLKHLSQHFEANWAEPSRDNKGNYRITLKPRQSSAYIERLEMVIAQEVTLPIASGTPPFYPVRSATVFGPSESKTTIVFRNARVNQGLTDNQFAFQVPDGVEVIRPDQQQFGF